jgi:hypothetical protein
MTSARICSTKDRATWERWAGSTWASCVCKPSQSATLNLQTTQPQLHQLAAEGVAQELVG